MYTIGFGECPVFVDRDVNVASGVLIGVVEGLLGEFARRNLARNERGAEFFWPVQFLAGTTVAAFSLLDTFWFERRRTPLPLRMLIAGFIGFLGEWTTGFMSDRVLGHCLQIWPESPLRYVSPSALPFWFLDYVVFHWLTRELRMAQDHRLSRG